MDRSLSYEYLKKNDTLQKFNFLFPLRLYFPKENKSCEPFRPKLLRLTSIAMHFICLYLGSKTSPLESPLEFALVSALLRVWLFFKCGRGFFFNPPGLYKLLLRWKVEVWRSFLLALFFKELQKSTQKINKKVWIMAGKCLHSEHGRTIGLGGGGVGGATSFPDFGRFVKPMYCNQEGQIQIVSTTLLLPRSHPHQIFRPSYGPAWWRNIWFVSVHCLKRNMAVVFKLQFWLITK